MDEIRAAAKAKDVVVFMEKIGQRALHVRDGKALAFTADEARELVAVARSFGIRITSHVDDLATMHGSGNPWSRIPHLIFEIGKLRSHVPVPVGFVLP